MTVSKSRFSNKRSLSNRSLAFKRAVAMRVPRRGLTLVEIMIALTMTLIVLGAMIAAFRYASEKMQLGRGVMEMSNRLRSVEEVLRNDLANLTLEPRPYTEAAAPNGFLEIIEGSNNDASITTVVGNSASYLGDYDDTIGMTVRSADGRRFRGVVNGVVLESTIAEVWYFATLNDLETDSIASSVDGTVDVDIEDSVRLHRRALLIRPDATAQIELALESITGANTDNVLTDLNDLYQFVRENDISIRVIAEVSGSTTQYRVLPNTLADLAVRQNRFAHSINTPADGVVFPNLLDTDTLSTFLLKDNGEDILLSDVAGFDVRVYSPNATVGYSATGLLIQPGDPEYTDDFLPDTPVAANRVGAFVDLDYGAALVDVSAEEWFASSTSTVLPSVYDTWTPVYERDGIDQDGDGVADQATDGLDNGGTEAPDDDAERETRPPYPHPIRGIQISTRIIDKTTQQVQQSSVIQSYVPE